MWVDERFLDRAFNFLMNYDVELRELFDCLLGI